MTVVTHPAVHPTVPATVVPVGRAAGWTLTALVTAFLLVDSVSKLLQIPPVVEATMQMGFPASAVPVIVGTLLACLVLHLVPRTAVLGAVLLTALPR